jgi:hypothetical protein
MVGGRGWSNDDFLSSLSGDDDEREQAREQYQDYSDRRAAFAERQGEILKTPQGQEFVRRQQERELRQLQQQQQQSSPDADGQDGLDDGFIMDGGVVEQGSGGGTRMARMMAQAKRMQEQQRKPMMGAGGMGGGGFAQKLIVPLDFENDEEAADGTTEGTD